MSINPYYRIARFEKDKSYWASYLLNEKNAPDVRQRIAFYHLLERDLKQLFDYIDPHDRNESVFSLRTHELLMRAAVEFESNAQAILNVNGYQKSGDLNMSDYKKIEQSSRLSGYTLQLPLFSPLKEFSPFDPWHRGSSLEWWNAYNASKHNRGDNFERANLLRAIEGVGAVFVILFSQFGTNVFDPYHPNDSYNTDDDDDDDDEEKFCYKENTLFAIKPFTGWGADEIYRSDFNPKKDEFSSFSF